MKDKIEQMPILFSKADIISYFSNEFQYRNWLYSRLKNNRIQKIRNDLYALVDISTGFPYANKFQIASQITKTSFVAYHSALEYYGLANQATLDCIVGTTTKFREFNFQDIEFSCLLFKDSFDVLNKYTEDIKVTSLEKTVIDCIDNINLGGGIDEILNALSFILYLSENKLIVALEHYDKIVLYQKVGFILEHFNDRLKLSEDFFNFCKSKLTNQIKYFLTDDFYKNSFNAKWQLVAPTNLLSRIYGGL